MASMEIDKGRFFLKDSIRQFVQFASTGQAQHLPAPPLEKSCPADLPLVHLPSGKEALQCLAVQPLGECIANRESIRTYSQESVTLAELSALLWAAQGLRQQVSHSTALRTVPSAGARHAFETYLAVDRVDSLQKGIYRYLPFSGQLVFLRPDEDIQTFAATACLHQGWMSKAAVNFFWATIPARMEWRYGLAAHKTIALDAGHVCQNLYLAGQAMGIGVCAVAAYHQEQCDMLLGLDGEEEFTIYAAATGKKQV